MRDVVAVIAPSDREAFLEEYASDARTFHDTELVKGREVEVPCLQDLWLFADLVPTEKTAKKLVDDIARWDKHPRPKDAALEVLLAVGPVCIPFLEKALAKKKAPVHKAFMTKALKALRAAKR